MANLSLWNSVVLYRDQWMEWNGWFRYALRSLQKTFFDKFRSIRSHMFFKIGVLKNVAIFTGKKLFWGLKNTSGCCFCTLCDKNNRKKNNFMAPFYGWGSTASRLEPLRWGSLLFTTKFPEITGTLWTYFIPSFIPKRFTLQESGDELVLLILTDDSHNEKIRFWCLYC